MRQQTLTHDQIVYNPAVNARGDSETDLGELKATIKALGLGQPLLVRPAPRGKKFEPVEGGRRYRAIGELIAEKALPKDFKIPVMVRELSDAEALELSLATAVPRLPLNAGDEALAFAELVRQGTPAAEIAAHFGVSERRVKQRLAIAGLPDKIVRALRNGKLGVEAAQAFTLGRDKKETLKLFDAMSQHGRFETWQIKRELTGKRVSANGREAKFVGAEAYRAAGGAVDEDLFSNDCWLSDAKLLAKLVDQKLKVEQKRLEAEGWSAVEINREGHGGKFANWTEIAPEGKTRLSKEQKDQIGKLKAEATKLRVESDKIQEAEEDFDADRDDAISARLDEIDRQIETLEGRFFTDEQKQKAVALIKFNHSDIEIQYLMKTAAAKAEAKARQSKQRAAEQSSVNGANAAPEEADFTGALQLEMAGAMTAAMQLAVAAKPKTALAAAAAALLTLESFGSAGHFGLLVDRLSRPSEALAKLQDHELIGLKDGSGDPALIFQLLLDRPVEDLMRLIALGLAGTFAFGSSIDGGGRAYIEAFDPDCAASWKPGEEFFRKMAKDALAEALSEADVPGVTGTKKKRELIEMAVRELPGTGWLPKPMRAPCYQGPGSQSYIEARELRQAEAAE